MFDRGFIDDPYPVYARLRAAGPLNWAGEFRGGAWLLNRYADVAAALRDTRLSSARSHMLTAQLPQEERAWFAAFDRTFAKWMLFLDAPEHTTLRRLMNKGFKPSMLERMRPRIERIVHDLIDAVEGQTHVDFMRDFAHPLPALVIADMLGVHASRWDDFIAWSDAIADFLGGPRPSLLAAHAAREGLIQLTEYFGAVLPERRVRKGDDLMSLLIRLEEEDGVLGAEELLAQCSLLFFAGHETTRNLHGNGLLALKRHPEQWARLERDRSLMQGALKELLRYDSPVQFATRIVAEDHMLHGRELKRGQLVACLIGSANRDPAQFSDPDRLDITRNEGSHLAFGFGLHACIGAALSYLEADIAFNALLDRMPDLELFDGPSSWSSNPAFRGLTSLPLAARGSRRRPAEASTPGHDMHGIATPA
jgi:cytochrome P450